MTAVLLPAACPGHKPFTCGRTARRQSSRSLHTRCSASPDVQTEKIKPDWAGEDVLSRAVNAAIGFKPLYGVMKEMARRAMQNSAEKSGVPWRQQVQELSETEEVYRIKDEIEDTSIEYPSYYLVPFHAYDNGNLDWTAAFECESATAAMGIRTWKDPALKPEQAQAKLRGNAFRCIEDFQQQNKARSVEDILDVGCSVGVSSRAIAGRYPAAQVTGLDLSPFFLAVAELRERRDGSSGRKRIRYMHALGERTSLPAMSFDIVHLGFIIHECPPYAIENLVKEAFRLLRHNGVLAIMDTNPKSKTIQNLPPALFTLMKSTEPWTDDYYPMDVEAAVEREGFVNVVTQEADHRHRAVLGLKP